MRGVRHSSALQFAECHRQTLQRQRRQRQQHRQLGGLNEDLFTSNLQQLGKAVQVERETNLLALPCRCHLGNQEQALHNR